MKHLRYASYLLRHRWFVFVECLRLGIVWRGIIHDASKFLPQEWFPYANHFAAGIQRGRDSTGYYKPTDTGDPAFDVAWLHHANHNDHHWQYWAQVTDDGGYTCLPMPEAAVKEMLADWRGAGRAQGTTGVGPWYRQNRDRIKLHDATRRLLHDLMRPEESSS